MPSIPESPGKRVGVAGFLHESNTFLGVPTSYEQFESTSLTRGQALLDRWQGAHHELGGFLAGAREQGLQVVPLYATFAVPSGTISAQAFERISKELLSSISAALPLDGLLLALHGATASEEHGDADGEILQRVRALVGPDLPIVTTLDLHANVSPRMIDLANATVAYRSNPHLDQADRGSEAAALMARILRGEVHPVQALETPPLLIHISKQYTSDEPARGLYTDLEEVTRWPGVLSASVAMGFYYADVSEMGASFWVVADGDEALARKGARWLAERAWARRSDFVGTLPTPAEAVHAAANAAAHPIALMDIGDNVGAGSPGDSTILFAEILRQNVPNCMVVLCDPGAAKACLEAGPGATVQLLVGGKADDRHGSPVPISGIVRTLSDGHFVETQVRHGGWGIGDQGLTAVVETPEQHTVVLTSLRMAPMSLEQVLSLGVHPERKQILIVKGVVAPRAAYAPVSADIVLVDTAGVSSDNPRNFAYRNRRAQLYPLEPDAAYEPSALGTSR
jgi:microcystin degradation protein MlrC